MDTKNKQIKSFCQFAKFVIGSLEICYFVLFVIPSGWTILYCEAVSGNYALLLLYYVVVL